MITLSGPDGAPVSVPESLADDQPYFSPSQLAAAAAYCRDEGYAVVRGLVSPESCRAVLAAFESEMRKTTTPMLRQRDMRYELNRYDEHGRLDNPLFNLQDLETRRFGGFKKAVLDILTQREVTRIAGACLGMAPEAGQVKVIQSMYFDAPAGTWAHQDSYYQDSAAGLGGAAAAWIALEDIHASAGRFYVYAKSHLDRQVLLNRGELNVATGHDTYRQAVREHARKRGFECRIPYLGQGDVLFWNSLTIHGSLGAQPGSAASRRSLTCHFLRDEDEMLQFHSRIRRQHYVVHNETRVGVLHRQDLLRTRMMREFAYRFPNAWARTRVTAIRALALLRRRSESPAVSPVVADRAMPG